MLACARLACARLACARLACAGLACAGRRAGFACAGRRAAGPLVTAHGGGVPSKAGRPATPRPCLSSFPRGPAVVPVPPRARRLAGPAGPPNPGTLAFTPSVCRRPTRRNTRRRTASPWLQGVKRCGAPVDYPRTPGCARHGIPLKMRATAANRDGEPIPRAARMQARKQGRAGRRWPSTPPRGLLRSRRT